MGSIIVRAFEKDQKIRREVVKEKIRGDSEVLSAYNQVGKFPHNDVKSWYRDIYEFYQNNEV